MYSFKKYFSLFIIFVVSFFSSYSIKNDFSKLTGKNNQWENPPIIVNCYPAFMPDKRLRQAIDYWESKNFKIAFYEYDPIKAICKKEFVEGFILIKIARYDELGDDTLAFTKRIAHYGIIKSSTIYMEFGTFNYPNLIEHELGHALGLEHKEIEGHIMHPFYHLMGSDYY